MTCIDTLAGYLEILDSQWKRPVVRYLLDDEKASMAADANRGGSTTGVNMPDLTIKSVPTSISKKTLIEVIETLGFQPDQVRELNLRKDMVFAEVLVQNEEGIGFADANGGAAIFRTHIAVQ